MLERFIQSQESNEEGGWLTVFGIGVSTERVAAFFSIGGSIVGYAFFVFVTGWLWPQLQASPIMA